MANLLDVLKKAATSAVANKVSEVKGALNAQTQQRLQLKQQQKNFIANPVAAVKTALDTGKAITKQDNAIKAAAASIEKQKQAEYAAQKAAYDKQVAAVQSSPLSDQRLKETLAKLNKPKEPTFIRKALSNESGKAMNQGVISPEQLRDVRYYEQLQGSPLTQQQLATYLEGNTPTLNTAWYNRFAAAGRDTVKPLTNAASKLDTAVKFTNPALYQDNELAAFNQAQDSANAAGVGAAWQTAKFTNPLLRGMTVAAPALTNAVGAVGGQEAKEVVNPFVNAYYKYNPKYIAGNLVTGGIQKGADIATNLITGKDTGVQGAIQDSTLSADQKDIASTLYQAGTNLIGAGAQRKLTNSSAKIKQQIKNDAESLRAGWEAFKRTGSLAAADEAAFTKSLPTKSKKTSGAQAEVLGFRTPEQKGIPVSKVVKQRKVNLSKFSDDQAVQAGVKQQIADAKKDTYVKKSFKEMEAEGKLLGQDIQKLLRKSKDGLVSAEENMALTQLVAEQQKLINELKLSPKKQEVQARIDQAQNLLNHALDKQLKGGTAVGRSLVSNRYLANITLDPEYWLARGEKNAGRSLNDTQRSKIDALAKAAQLDPSSQNKIALAKYVAEIEKPTWYKNASGVYKAALIASPKTVLRNFLQTKALSTLETLKDLPGAAVDKVVGLKTGERGTVFSKGAVGRKIASVPQGIKDAVQTLRTGTSALGLENTFEVPRELRLNNRFLDATLGNMARASFRIASAGDAPFKRSNYNYSIAKQAEVQAINEGLKGKAKSDRIKEIIANPSIEARKIAGDDAKMATYQTDLPFVQSFNKMVGDNAASQLASDAVVPFKQIPINVFKTFAYDYSPLGGVGAIMRAAKQRKGNEFNQKQFSDSIGRSILGTGIIGAGMALGGGGYVSPSLPTDKNPREMALEEGKQGNDLTVPFTDWKVDSKQLGTPGQLLALGSDIAAIKKNNGGSLNADAVGQIAGKGLRLVADQPFLQGASRFIDAFKDPERSGGTFVRSAFSGLVPPVVNAIATALSPEQRNTKTFGDVLASRVPLLRDDVSKRMGIWGEPRKTAAADSGIFSIFDPVNFHKTKDDPVLNEMRRLNIDIGLPTDTLNGVKLTPKEYEVYQGTAGYNIKQSLDLLMNDPLYQKIPDSQKPDAISAVIDTQREIANEVTFSDAMRKRYSLPDASILPDDVVIDASKMVTSEVGYSDKTTAQKEKALKDGLELAVEAFNMVQQRAQSDEVARQMQEMDDLIRQKEQEEQLQLLRGQLEEQEVNNSLLELDY